MAANQTGYSRLEQRSVTKFLLAENANRVKFTEECLMYMEKNILDSRWSGNSDSPVKKTSWVQRPVNKVMLTVF